MDDEHLLISCCFVLTPFALGMPGTFEDDVLPYLPRVA